jgi:regulator of protease activity HflC (stomatin/prohibitin superfamily)
MISLVLSVLAIAGLAIAGFGVFLITQAVQRRDTTRGGILLTAVGVVIAAIFFIMSAGVVEVKANEVGVVFNTLNGDLADTPLGPGMHIIIPGIQEVTIYSVAQQEYTMSGRIGEGAVQGEDAVEALTNDGQQVRLDVTIIYRIDPAKANEIHVKWQNRYQNGLVRPTIREAAREVVGKFDVQEIYSEKRAELGVEIQDFATEKMGRDGLQVVDVLIRNIVFSQEYVDSIEQKQVAQQQALEAQFRVEQKKQEADQAREEARGRADAARIEAQGEADALQLVNVQLSQNPALIQWRYVENLSDNVQLILLPSNSPFLFDLQSLMNATGTAVTPPTTGSE